jgi:hypothetical protein
VLWGLGQLNWGGLKFARSDHGCWGANPMGNWAFLRVTARDQRGWHPRWSQLLATDFLLSAIYYKTKCNSGAPEFGFLRYAGGKVLRQVRALTYAKHFLA